MSISGDAQRRRFTIGVLVCASLVAAVAAGALRSSAPAAAHVDSTAAAFGGDTYTVSILTGTRNGAGTNAIVHIVIYGPGCVIARAKLNHPGVNDFRAGTTDTFASVKGHNLSDDHVSGIELYHDNTHDGAPWFVETVKLVNNRTHKTRTFQLHRWLSKANTPYVIRVYADKDGEVTPLPDANPTVVKSLPQTMCDDQ